MEKREFLEKYIADRHNTNCSKWDGLKEKFGEDGLLPMWGERRSGWGGI